MTGTFKTIVSKAFTFASTTAILFVAITSARADQCGSAAGNLIVNCGFENGATVPGGNIPAGWTVGQWTSEEAIYNSSPVNSGDSSLRIANDEGMGGPLFDGAAILSQSFNDVAGEVYDFNFYLYGNSPTSSNQLFQAFYDSTAGTPLLASDGSNLDSAFTEYSFSVVGTGLDSITFTSYNNASWFWLDDVEVLDTGVNSNPSPTPEPGSLILLGTGLVGAFAARRRLGR